MRTPAALVGVRAPSRTPHPVIRVGRRSQRPGRRARLMVPALLATALLAPSFASPAPAQAAMSATQAEAQILTWVNQSRAARGLRPLVRWYDLAVVAGRRATAMAQTNTLSHTIAGNLGSQLASRGVTWYRYGEVIAYTHATWTYEAARSLFELWRGSSPHWTLLMSDRFNYAGVGMALRSSNRRTFGAIVLTESIDHTGAKARFTGASRSGTDLRWTWAGSDVQLQTHTAGFRDFDVQYRVDSGPWRWIANDTTGTGLRLFDRVPGRAYHLRVRGTDRRGNVGAWTTSTIRVP